MKKLMFLLALVIIISCGVFNDPPNLTVKNNYHNAQLRVIEIITGETHIDQGIRKGVKEEFTLDQGTYHVHLICYEGPDPTKNDRIIEVHVWDPSYTIHNITFD